MFDDTTCDFFNTRKFKQFTKEEEIAIFKKYRASKDEGEKIKLRNEIIERNIGLVRIITRKFYKKHNTQYQNGDLVSEGVLGLMVAIRKFDYRLGYKFSTFAFHNIWQKMNLELQGHPSNSLKIPPCSYSTYKKYKENNPDKLNTKEFLEKRMDIENASRSFVRLDKELVFDGEDSNITKQLTDNSEDSFTIIHNKMKKEKLVEVIDYTLAPRARYILKRYLNINEETNRPTLEIIAKEFGLTKECIRSIVKRAATEVRYALKNYDDIDMHRKIKNV